MTFYKSTSIFVWWDELKFALQLFFCIQSCGKLEIFFIYFLYFAMFISARNDSPSKNVITQGEKVLEMIWFWKKSRTILLYTFKIPVIRVEFYLTVEITFIEWEITIFRYRLHKCTSISPVICNNHHTPEWTQRLPVWCMLELSVLSVHTHLYTSHS